MDAEFARAPRAVLTVAGSSVLESDRTGHQVLETLQTFRCLARERATPGLTRGRGRMRYLFTPPAPVTVAILGASDRFPVHRIYCLARNNARHAQEMGFSGHEPPSFFLKPADAEALQAVEAGQTATIRYPSLTRKLFHEIELVIAVGTGGTNIRMQDADRHIFGYAVGLDMTRQDLLDDLSREGRPWCVGKAFDHSAVIGPITPAAAAPAVDRAEIFLKVNGGDRQRSDLSRLIWDRRKILEQLSLRWELRPGDLIYTGTPDGVAAVVPGDILEGGVAGLGSLRAIITAGESAGDERRGI